MAIAPRIRKSNSWHSDSSKTLFGKMFLELLEDMPLWLSEAHLVSVMLLTQAVDRRFKMAWKPAVYEYSSQASSLRGFLKIAASVGLLPPRTIL